MRQLLRRPGPVLLSLFVVSGFAGLIYQSLWSHYLGLTLGHAAYAQSLVLAIFMGGMALGAWLAGRYSSHWRRLLLMYAMAEGLIGLYGLGFHALFFGYSAISQDSLLPALGTGMSGRIYPWLSAACMILPACILLGATFPLLSAGYLRAIPEPEGRVFGGLYFANSLGAAAGALTATFVLLPAVGLPGAMKFAGVANLLVAAGAWWVSRQLREHESPAGPVRSAGHERSEDVPDPSLARRLLVVAFLSGGFSFVYEIGWIRMLNQALGTTLHAFELMLAAFLLGLAFGGWWVRRRVAATSDAIRIAGFAQVAMGTCALLSVVVFANSFEWVGWMMGALSRNAGGYALFSLGSAGIAMLVMFPAAFFAGMTLPLFTMALMRTGSGEAGIGRIYAANTLGAIAGVLLMMHVLIPLIGVRPGLMLAAVGDALLGFWLLGKARADVPLRRVGVAALVLGAALMLGLVFGNPDPREQAGGVFRHGAVRLAEESEVPFLRDGKTATVAVVRSRANDSAAIITNGKSDAAMSLHLQTAPRSDESTMVMLGALPLAVHPDPRSIGVIGWGSGLTTHTLLGSPQVRRVETVEIEPMIHAGARLFGDRVARAYQDPRSHVHFDDARRFFASGQREYDVIVSEPSNPWVSGVANLFTREFYGFLRGHMASDGILVQWLQTYELDDAMLATMLAALLAEFPEAEAYLSHDVDLIIVAYPQRLEPAYARLQTPNLAPELQRVGLGNAEELALRRIGGRKLLETFVRAYDAPAHSDFHPSVALRAPAMRFRGTSSNTLQLLVDNGMPVLDLLEARVPQPAGADILLFADHRFTVAHHDAVQIAKLLREGRHPGQSLTLLDDDRAMRLESLRSLSARGRVDDVWLWAEAASTLAEASVGLLPAEDLHGVWIEPAWIDAGTDQPLPVRLMLSMYAAAASREPADMRDTGEAVLRMPDRVPARVREQALVIAQLGAIGSGDMAAVETLHATHGATLAYGERLRMVRYLLRVWARDAGRVATSESGPEARR